MADLTDVLGGFLMVSQQGRLFALRSLQASESLDSFTPRLCQTTLEAVESLVVRLKASPMVLVVHPGTPLRSYLITTLKVGTSARKAKVFQRTAEVVMEAVEAGGWPVVHLGELQRAAAAMRNNEVPLSVPIRWAELRTHLPREWLDALRGVFVSNTEPADDKEELLYDSVLRLRNEIGRWMIEGWLTHCLWLDNETGLVGRAAPNRDRTGLSSVITGGAELTDFVRALAYGTDGRLRTYDGVATIITSLMRGRPWNGPTLHVYDAAMRARHHLDEYYSLYRGLLALSSFGAPVLGFQRGPLPQAIPVMLLEATTQGGAVARMGVRSYPTRNLVWDTAPVPDRY